MVQDERAKKTNDGAEKLPPSGKKERAWQKPGD